MTTLGWLTFAAMVVASVPIGLACVRLAGRSAWTWLHTGQALNDPHRPAGKKMIIRLDGSSERIAAGVLMVFFSGLLLLPHLVIEKALQSSGATKGGQAELVLRHQYDVRHGPDYSIWVRPLGSWPVPEDSKPPAKFVSASRGTVATIENVVELDATELQYNAL